jgi:S-formylglutathione hydrolase FrmB
MPKHPFQSLEGEIRILTIESTALSNNILGDPTSRQVAVYLPPGWNESMREYPLLVDLVGYTGSGFFHTNWKAFHETVPQRVERLVREGKMGEVIVAFPDCFTSLAGNQYINSLAVGNWADFLLQEMIPAIESQFPARKGAQNRAVFGKSSGGYGAIVHGMLYADHWGAIACHSGDMGFPELFLGEFPKSLTHMNKYGGLEGFLQHIKECPKPKDNDLHVLMIIAMGAFYDPDPNGPMGIRLPVDLYSCALDQERWKVWLNHDPVQMVERPEVQNNLRSLKTVFIDCGFRDQYQIHFGSRQLTQRLIALDIPHLYEEFDDTHSTIDYRMDRSLPLLYKAVT